MKVDYVLLGTRLKEQRQRRMLTQQQLAEKVSLTPGFISRIETGKKKPSLEALLSICKALNITLNDLLVGNQIPQESDYNAEIAELLFNYNESERRLIFEITKAVYKAIKKNHRRSELWRNVLTTLYTIVKE